MVVELKGIMQSPEGEDDELRGRRSTGPQAMWQAAPRIRFTSTLPINCIAWRVQTYISRNSDVSSYLNGGNEVSLSDAVDRRRITYVLQGSQRLSAHCREQVG
jgi:hypothetical protein